MGGKGEKKKSNGRKRGERDKGNLTGCLRGLNELKEKEKRGEKEHKRLHSLPSPKIRGKRKGGKELK
jgi:hypothetical protein